MPSCRCYVVASLCLVVAVLTVESGDCQPGSPTTVWGPYHDNALLNRLINLVPRLFSFPSREECQDALCVPRCGRTADTSTPNGSPRQESSLVNSTDGHNSRRPVATIPDELSTNIGQAGVFLNLTDILQAFGRRTKTLRDDDGQVVGVEAAPEISANQGVLAANTNRRIPSSGREGSTLEEDDAAVCCSTIERFYFNSTLVDYYGRTQTIAQIEQVGVYQLIRHGLCGTKGSCPGECNEIYVTIPLVVHPPLGEDIRYSLFKVPGYCACRVRANG
ncbi:hypothetical protein EGW08_018944 [Elysia chlorotica]|uniref:Spaetzle domain-containing protein n=1 Tax=Elysia chlorotica TaxID=188477 RepID=A0A3S1B2A6_ELYCH|nr:hypothetical protein EGW08_018944 [Elysia chlorotica]